MAEPVKMDPIVKDQVVKTFTDILGRRKEQAAIEQQQPLGKSDIITLAELPVGSYTTREADTSSYTVSSSAPVAGYTRYYSVSHTTYASSDLQARCATVFDKLNGQIQEGLARNQEGYWNGFKWMAPTPTSANATIGDRQAVDAHNLSTQKYIGNLVTGVKAMDLFVSQITNQDASFKRDRVVNNLAEVREVLFKAGVTQPSQLTPKVVESLKQTLTSHTQDPVSLKIVDLLLADEFKGNAQFFTVLTDNNVQYKDLQLLLDNEPKQGGLSPHQIFDATASYTANHMYELVADLQIPEQKAEFDQSKKYSWSYESARLMTPAYLQAVLTGQGSGYQRTHFSEAKAKVHQDKMVSYAQDVNLQLLQSMTAHRNSQQVENYFAKFGYADIKEIRLAFLEGKYKPELTQKFGITSKQFDEFSKNGQGLRLFSAMECGFNTKYHLQGSEKPECHDLMAFYQDNPQVKPNLELLNRLAQPSYQPTMADAALMIDYTLTVLQNRMAPTRALNKEGNGYSLEGYAEGCTKEKIEGNSQFTQDLAKFGIPKEALLKFTQFKVDGVEKNILFEFSNLYKDPSKFDAVFKADTQKYGGGRLLTIQSILGTQISAFNGIAPPLAEVAQVGKDHRAIMFSSNGKSNSNPVLGYANIIEKLNLKTPQQATQLGQKLLSLDVKANDFNEKVEALVKDNQLPLSTDEVKQLLTFNPEGWNQEKLGNFTCRFLSKMESDSGVAQASVFKAINGGNSLTVDSVLKFFRDRQEPNGTVKDNSVFNHLVKSIDAKEVAYTNETLFGKFIDGLKITTYYEGQESKKPLERTQAIANDLEKVIAKMGGSEFKAAAEEFIKTYNLPDFSSEKLKQIIQFKPDGYKDLDGSFVHRLMQSMSFEQEKDPAKHTYFFDSNKKSTCLEMYSKNYGDNKPFLDEAWAKKFLEMKSDVHPKSQLAKAEFARMQKEGITGAKPVVENQQPSTPSVLPGVDNKKSIQVTLDQIYSSASLATPANKTSTYDQLNSIYATSVPEGMNARAFDFNAIYCSSQSETSFNPLESGMQQQNSCGGFGATYSNSLAFSANACNPFQQSSFGPRSLC